MVDLHILSLAPSVAKASKDGLGVSSGMNLSDVWLTCATSTKLPGMPEPRERR